eukprot:gene17872-biopygen13276
MGDLVKQESRTGPDDVQTAGLEQELVKTGGVSPKEREIKTGIPQRNGDRGAARNTPAVALLRRAGGGNSAHDTRASAHAPPRSGTRHGRAPAPGPRTPPHAARRHSQSADPQEAGIVMDHRQESGIVMGQESGIAAVIPATTICRRGTRQSRAPFRQRQRSVTMGSVGAAADCSFGAKRVSLRFS